MRLQGSLVAAPELLSCSRALKLFFSLIFKIFWMRRMACGILVTRPGIETVPPAVEARSPNHWTTREVLKLLNLDDFFSF